MAEEESVWKKIGDGIVVAAPGIAKTIASFVPGGSLVVGGIEAISAIGKAFGLGDNPEPEALEKAIATDPQAALKLKMAEQDFQLKMKDYEIQEFKTQVESIKNAQDRQIKHEEATGKSDVNLYALAWTVVIGFLALVVFLLYVPVPSDQSGVIFMLFGSLATGFGQVLQYFFGSSKGSDAKTVMLGKGATK